MILIEQFIDEAQRARDTPLPDDVAFEIFSATMVLADMNLTDEEIAAGRIGGGRDGGIDGVYTFLDGALLESDDPIFEDGFSPKSLRRGPELTLHLVQAKRESSFKETAFEKAILSTTKLFDLNLSDEEVLKIYSPELVERIRIFTRAWLLLGIRAPRITVHFSYATKASTTNIAAGVQHKAQDFIDHVSAQIPGATGEASMLGAHELWESATTLPEYDLQIRFEDYVSKEDSYLGLVRLPDLYRFFTDESGNLLSHLFDSNVRDYQGSIAVNRQIRQSLRDDEARDFWWFNNGVTVICSKAHIGGSKTFTLSDVQIVNGLQTSHTIHQALSETDLDSEPNSGKSVQVRIIETRDEKTRDDVIRATNSQTKVPDASLHATEDIHRQIESHFAAEGWYYDRRKNFYKNMGKPSDRIVSIPALGQAMAAITLGRPDDARARPTTLLNNEADYKAMFSESVPLPVYLWAAKLQRRIDSLLLAPELETDSFTRTNTRFLVSMFVAIQKVGSQVRSPHQLMGIVDSGPDLTIEDVQRAFLAVAEVARILSEEKGWALDRASKSRELAERVAKRALGS
ncbi:AIPR family protein [Leucobacter sp. PH1c]|uniref:AIPR family protein n=1 Tax=Leucobacter sp. PH1c TaxID=1397278 RepID=UPI0009DF9806|nr:AIPR family protein [Leucobacter sp. PH1c]